LFVRSRWPGERRKATEGKHGLQGSALQDADRVLPRRTGDPRLGLGKTDYMAASRVVHYSLPRCSVRRRHHSDSRGATNQAIVTRVGSSPAQ
jgi:hypothetical protein